MTHQIRDEAIKLGYIDARPVTGHPFDAWLNFLKSIPLGRLLTFEHDPAKASGWPLDEITIWVAIAPTPPVAAGKSQACTCTPRRAKYAKKHGRMRQLL